MTEPLPSLFTQKADHGVFLVTLISSTSSTSVLVPKPELERMQRDIQKALEARNE